MVSNFDVLPPEVSAGGALDLHKALRVAMMAGWPTLQFASNHCELTAALVFQSSTIVRGGQHWWDAPQVCGGLHHGYRRAVGEDYAGVARDDDSMLPAGDCTRVRER